MLTWLCLEWNGVARRELEAGVGKKAQKQVNMGECFFMLLWFNR